MISKVQKEISIFPPNSKSFEVENSKVQIDIFKPLQISKSKTNNKRADFTFPYDTLFGFSGNAIYSSLIISQRKK